MQKKHILHLVSKLPEKYNSKFVEFCHDRLTDYEHTYVALVSGGHANEDRQLGGARVLNLNDMGRLEKMCTLLRLFRSPEYELVVFHGLFYTGPFLFFLAGLFRFSKLAEKTLWMTWGGDIYYFQNRPDTWLGALNEFCRKQIIQRLFFISSLIPDELELIRINYGAKAVQLDAFYPNPTAYRDFGMATEAQKESDKLSFLLGNSADPQNNHLEMINALGHLAGSVKVYCILSYAIVDVAYVERVKALGRELFGEDFVALTEFMKPAEYQDFLRDIDFACYNHNRQQAMGNIFQFLYMGKAVFLRQDTLSCLFLQQHGLPVQDTQRLEDLSFEDLQGLKAMAVDKQMENQGIIYENFSDIAAGRKWQRMLTRVLALLKKKG